MEREREGWREGKRVREGRRGDGDEKRVVEVQKKGSEGGRGGKGGKRGGGEGGSSAEHFHPHNSLLIHR